MDYTKLAVLHDTLTHDLPDAPWPRLLDTLNTTGVADSGQLGDVTGLARDPLKRLIAKLNYLAGSLPSVVVELDHTLPRPGIRGRAPTVYKLGETGAALLRQLDAATYEDAHACQLNADTPLTHARDMLDVHLAARRANVAITTDRALEYAAGRVLRPDHVITLSEGARYLIENEGAASADVLRRMRDSLQHRAQFFASPDSRGVQPLVRMLINLPRGTHLDRTLHFWDQAIRSVFQPPTAPPFRLLAMPLAEFLAEPNWDLDPSVHDARWLDLTPAPTVPTPKPPTTRPTGQTTAPVAATAPAGWLRSSPHDDVLLLEALWENYLAAAVEPLAEIPDLSSKFWELVRLIYSASFDFARRPYSLASYPRASIYLLRHYLHLHPPLKASLQAALKRGQAASRWNVTLLRQWMQTVIDAFLTYHGCASGQSLLARAVVTDWEDEDATHAIDVSVWIQSPEVLMDPLESGVVPARDEVARTARALGWVLHALFAYARQLDLGQPPAFW